MERGAGEECCGRTRYRDRYRDWGRLGAGCCGSSPGDRCAKVGGVCAETEEAGGGGAGCRGEAGTEQRIRAAGEAESRLECGDAVRKSAGGGCRSGESSI